MAECRIDFQIMRRRNGEDSIDQAAHMALSAIQNDEYDVTSPGEAR